MSKISDKLNYNIDNIDERLEVVNMLIDEYDEEIINFYDEHYNPHINQTGFLSENTKMGKDLEALANYLLYAKDSEAEDIITDYKKKRNNIREASINKLIKIKEYKKETNKSIMKVPKVKVKKKDRREYAELAQTGEAIDRLTKMIKSGVDSNGEKLSQSEIRKLKWIRTDIQKDEVVMKSELKRYISVGTSKHEKDMNALSYIRFDDPEIIRILIDDYSELKEQSYEDTFGYMKIIIFALEELIDNTDFKDYIKDILKWKIENIPYDEMIVMLEDKHKLNLTKPRLSKITRETIPNMIVETYKKQKEDWFYTFVMKGTYKTCSSCKTNHLATTKYFNPNKTSKSGFRSVCKECRRKSIKNRCQPKKNNFLV